MNPLQLRLAALRRRLRFVVTCRGACWVFALLLLTAAGAGLLDWRLPGHLPSLVRALVLTGSLGGAGYVGYRWLVRPLATPADDLSLALRVEAHYPVLNDALASAVQFLEQPADAAGAGSPSLRREVVERALGLVKGFDFRPVVDARGVGAAGLSLAGAGTLALALTLLSPQAVGTALLRLAQPFGGPDWPRQTQLTVQARSRVARGEAFAIQATVTGIIPERADVSYHFDGSPPFEQHYEVTPADTPATGTLVARLEPERVQRRFRFQVRANDAASAWYEVEVLPPPQLVLLAGRPSPQIRLDPPAYTDLPPHDLPDGTSTIEAPAGTHIVLRAATDRPLVQAWLEYPGNLEPALNVAACLSPLGMPPPLAALELAAGPLTPWRRIPARLAAGGQILMLDWTARVSGTFTLRFQDEMGLANTRLVELHAVTDPAPVVYLERPSRSQDSLDVLPDADVPLQVRAEDPLYALRSISLEYRRRQGEEGVAGGPGQLPLYDHAVLGRALPQLLAAASAWPAPALAWRLRLPRMEVGRRWSLAGLGLKEGDVLVLQAWADDFDDVTAAKPPGRSQEVELRVVSRTALDLALNEAQAQIHQELLRLQKQQQEALEKVISAQAQWRNGGRLRPKDVDDLVQAEQLQQQIRGRVGTEREGLRAEAARILRAARDNHLPRSGMQDRMEAVAAELARLAREELGQIEPRLTEARKENDLSQARKGNEREPAKRPPRAKDQGPLPEARKHQEEVEKTLGGLLKLLEPWTSTHEVQGEAKSILQDQRKLAGQTEKLARDPELTGQSPDELKPEQRTELDRAAELQSRLAERTEQLLEKLERLAGEKARGDEMAGQMEKAAKRGRDSDAVENMRKGSGNLAQNHTREASSQQQASARAMAEVIKELEDRREEDLDRLIKKMKEAEQKLADLADRQERLQKKVRDAGRIADAREREEALKRLAREQQELRREAQEMVRELSRLRAEQAGRALSQAGGRMEQAGRRMDQGDNPQEQQDEALDRLNEAQRQLRQAREEAEEELAHEKLAKVADQIKGLRRRQEPLLAEAARIHREVLQQNHWTRGLGASFSGLAGDQEGLGEETAQVKEKLADARVFARLLEKAAGAMRQASERIKEHHEAVQQRDDPALDRQAEDAADAQIQKLQRTALRRLDQVLDALKPEAGMAMRLAQGRAGGGQGGGSPSAGAGDGIPPLAQLKALRTLQQEVNERTREFGQRHPDTTRLTASDQEELRAIRQEQQEVADLFHDVTAPAEPEEGDKK